MERGNEEIAFHLLKFIWSPIAIGVSDLSPAGFGEQVRESMDRRRETLIERGDAARQPDGRTAYRRNLIATLQEREVARAGEDIAAKKSLPFRAAADDGDRPSCHAGHRWHRRCQRRSRRARADPCR
jgi:hypothetical protein